MSSVGAAAAIDAVIDAAFDAVIDAEFASAATGSGGR
jgi:hypothetical protein